MIGLLIDLVDMIRGGGRKQKVLASVVVRLKHFGFVDAARQRIGAIAGPTDDESALAMRLPITRPFAGDLVLAYAIDGSTELSYVSRDFLIRHKLGEEELHEAALANTRGQIMKGVSIGQTRTFQGLETKLAGLAATVAVFPEFWKPIEARAGAGLIAAIPGREFLCFLALPTEQPARNDALVRSWIMKNAAIAAFEESENHALSELTFSVRDGKFEARERLDEQDPELTRLLASADGDALLAKYPS